MQRDSGQRGRVGGRLSVDGLLFLVSNFCHTEPYHLFLCVTGLRSLLVTSFYIILWFSWAVVFTRAPLITSLIQLWLLNTFLRKGHLCHYHIFELLLTVLKLCLIPSLHVFVHFQAKMMKEFSSVAQSCLILHDPLDCSTPDLPVHLQLPEVTQTHVHWVGDAIQPSHPLSSPSPPTFSLSQHKGLFQWVSFSHQVAKVL